MCVLCVDNVEMTIDILLLCHQGSSIYGVHQLSVYLITVAICWKIVLKKVHALD
jgi:hypothetical protein